MVKGVKKPRHSRKEAGLEITATIKFSNTQISPQNFPENT
jgi:hypothetical protein